MYITITCIQSFIESQILLSTGVWGDGLSAAAHPHVLGAILGAGNTVMIKVERSVLSQNFNSIGEYK